ncbi:HD domain-containing protein [Bariatricus sp. SGI.154]|uniref:HD domain-containing protein n=1 Tax=Bariatricus sp. SGI.154 TaxID=3420549 RepID=UPI003CFD7E01
MDLQYAKEQFENYLNHYDRDDDKVRLKIVHTYGVVECSGEIAWRMRLSKEDTELAQLIGLLHDIGRFEQLKRFDSFEPDTMDHASFGVQILFDEGMIREFVKDDKWDDIIRIAIARHSDFKLEGIEDERTLMHARIIRDADKLDNCRVKLEDSVETILGVSAEEVGGMEISNEVMEQFRCKKSILSSTRRTKMDYWVSYLAYFFDINYEVSFELIHEQNYIDLLIDRIPYSNTETASKMEEIRDVLREYTKIVRHF